MLPVKIAVSVLAGRKRVFTKDSEHLSSKFERPVVLGLDNIPTGSTPTVIACNHASLYDFAAGTVHLTRLFSQRRFEAGVPGNIRWMAAKNIISRSSSPVDHKILYPAINKALEKIHQTYDFIPVPINYLDVHKQKPERAGALLVARRYLRAGPYSTIGIFPEGDFERDEQPLSYFSGVGMLCKSMGIAVNVLPTSIYRSAEGKLTLSFGQTLRIDSSYSALEITNGIKEAVDALKKNP